MFLFLHKGEVPGTGGQKMMIMGGFIFIENPQLVSDMHLSSAESFPPGCRHFLQPKRRDSFLKRLQSDLSAQIAKK